MSDCFLFLSRHFRIDPQALIAIGCDCLLLLLDVQAATAMTAHAPATTTPSVRVEILNLRDNERLTFPLVLVEGIAARPSPVSDSSDDEAPTIEFIHASVRDASTASAALSWPVVPDTGRFKALVMLPRPGTHCIQLRVHGELVHELMIRYTHPLSKHIARFHYEKRMNDSRGFDAPAGVDNSDAAALKRVKLGALLMQTCIAEMFHKQGLPRATIALEFDDSEECEVPRADILETTDEDMEGRSQVTAITRALRRQTAAAAAEGVTLTHFVHVGSNHFDPATRTVSNHCAHMYDNAFLFSAVTLHTWPSALNEVTKCLLDTRRIDTSTLNEDSAGRGSYWANFATGFGVFMHFFVRRFSRRNSYRGMFGRGFDNVNRLLSVFEPELESDEPAVQVHVERSGDAAATLVANHETTDETIELNYSVLEEVGDDVHGAFVEGPVLAALLEQCPFVVSANKYSHDHANAAAAA